MEQTQRLVQIRDQYKKLAKAEDYWRSVEEVC